MIIFILEDLCSHFGCLLCSDRLFILSLLSFLIYLSFQNSLFRINFNSQLYKIYYLPKSLVIFDFICKIVHFINSILSWIALEYQNMYFLKNQTFYFYCSHIFAKPQNPKTPKPRILGLNIFKIKLYIFLTYQPYQLS